jgi:hypothetical protein
MRIALYNGMDSSSWVVHSRGTGKVRDMPGWSAGVVKS